MRRERVSVPRPRSSFVLVQCPKCMNEQSVFSSTASDINCKVCRELLVESTGGKGALKGALVRRLD